MLQRKQKFADWLTESIKLFDQGIPESTDTDYKNCELQRQHGLKYLKNIQSAFAQITALEKLIWHVVLKVKPLEINPVFEVKSESSFVLVEKLKICLSNFAKVDNNTLPTGTNMAFSYYGVPAVLDLVNKEIQSRLDNYKKPLPEQKKSENIPLGDFLKTAAKNITIEPEIKDELPSASSTLIFRV